MVIILQMTITVFSNGGSVWDVTSRGLQDNGLNR